MKSSHNPAATKKLTAVPSHGKNFVRSADPVTPLGIGPRFVAFIDIFTDVTRCKTPAESNENALLSELEGNIREAKGARYAALVAQPDFDECLAYARWHFYPHTDAFQDRVVEIATLKFRDKRQLFRTAENAITSAFTLGLHRSEAQIAEADLRFNADRLIFACWSWHCLANRPATDAVLALNERSSSHGRNRDISHCTVTRHVDHHASIIRRGLERFKKDTGASISAGELEIAYFTFCIETWLKVEHVWRRCAALGRPDKVIGDAIESGLVFDWLAELKIDEASVLAAAHAAYCKLLSREIAKLKKLQARFYSRA